MTRSRMLPVFLIVLFLLVLFWAGSQSNGARANPPGRSPPANAIRHHHASPAPAHRHRFGGHWTAYPSFYYGTSGFGATFFGYGLPGYWGASYWPYFDGPGLIGGGNFYLPNYAYADYWQLGYGPTGILGMAANGGFDALGGPAIIDSRPIIVLPPARKDADAGGEPAALKEGEAAKPAERPVERGAPEPPLVIRPRTRVSPPAAKQRCERFVEIGDRFFRQQQYDDALSQYKNAAAAAPDMGLPLFRQAFAYIATRRFDSAIQAMRRAVLVDPESVRHRDSLAALYGDQLAAIHSHQELLATRALDTPNDPTPLLLLGFIFSFDGNFERAERFFRAAEPLLGPHDELIAAFVGNET